MGHQRVSAEHSLGEFLEKKVAEQLNVKPEEICRETDELNYYLIYLNLTEGS